MFSELDDLKQLTQAVALESLDFTKEKEDEEEADHGAMIIDGEMDNRPFEKGDKIQVIRVQGDADKKPIATTATVGGSSGNLTSDKIKAKRPIFEQKPDSELTDSDLEGIFGKGLGAHIGGIGSLKKALECCVDGDPDCEHQFHPGDYVKAKSGKVPVILVIKHSDGPVITTAKPTNNMDEYCEGNDGCWPEFHFNQDEIEPMDGLSLGDIMNVMAFNDAQMESLTDGSIDEDAQKGIVDKTNDMLREKSLEGADDCKPGEFCDQKDLIDRMDEIFGNQSYTFASPKVTTLDRNGNIETSQSAGKISFGEF